jgi:OOP family OmpA-OmpF porin
MKNAIVGSLIAFLAGVAQASPYVTGSLGTSTVDACDGVDDCDDGSTGFKILGGYKFNPNIAVEAGYFSFGKASAGGETLKATGLGIGGAFHYDTGSDFVVFGRLGVADMKAKNEFGSESFSDSSSQLYGGIGLGYKLSATTTIDASYDFSKIEIVEDEFDVNMFSVGLTFSF